MAGRSCNRHTPRRYIVNNCRYFMERNKVQFFGGPAQNSPLQMIGAASLMSFHQWTQLPFDYSRQSDPSNRCQSDQSAPSTWRWHLPRRRQPLNGNFKETEMHSAVLSCSVEGRSLFLRYTGRQAFNCRLRNKRNLTPRQLAIEARFLAFVAPFFGGKLSSFFLPSPPFSFMKWNF
jgi:hypothetical protein